MRALLLSLLLALPLAAGAGSDRLIAASTSYSGKVALNKPLVVPVDIDGVKVESVFFSDTEALVIVWNKGTRNVEPRVGLALFDAKGRLLATGTDESGLRLGGDTLKPGKQLSYKFSFDDFMQNTGTARTFQLVFALTARKPGSKPADD